MVAQIGKPAPEFSAAAYANGKITDKEVSLKDYKGKWVVLFFYPLDFTFVCPTEIQGFDQKKAEFDKLNAKSWVAALTAFTPTKAWSRRRFGSTELPAVVRYQPPRISRDYGVLLEDKGISLRGLFIIDPDGVLRRSYLVNDLSVGRNVDEVIRLLQTFSPANCARLAGSPALPPSAKPKLQPSFPRHRTRWPCCRVLFCLINDSGYFHQ